METISVIVPRNPFVRDGQDVDHCLAALDVAKLMQWWPGKPHTPHRNARKVKSIQRSLDWKRVAHIASYLLQREIVDAPKRLDKVFRGIYEPKANDPGRQWPPKIPRVIGYEPSGFPMFSNVLLHVNGAELKVEENEHTATLIFDELDKDLNFTVIDGQHRINGAYFALCLLKDDGNDVNWDIPAEVFLDLDPPSGPPRRQAQIFIDVNFYQKKVDRSLVADLFPTARDPKDQLTEIERAQDLGRTLMLEKGPLVGMIQIPGIKYGVKDVVTLATLNGAIEDILYSLEAADLTSLEEQSDFLSICLHAWLDATNRRQDIADTAALDSDNVVYQGRVLVSYLTLVPACIDALRSARCRLISEKAQITLTSWLKKLLKRAGLLKNGKFLSKTEFTEKKYLGSGGLARFRDRLWAAAMSPKSLGRTRVETIATRASEARAEVREKLMRKARD